jgi:hypothetical protein
MAIKEVWCAFEHTQSRNALIGVFSTKLRAEDAAINKGEWGSAGDVRSRQAFQCEHQNLYYLLDSSMPAPVDIDNIKAQKEEKRKAELLSSLSEEDKRILGLT